MGDLYAVGEVRLHLQGWGSAGPVVVLEAGSTDFSLTWERLGPRLGLFTRAYAYDRAGVGWSEPSPRRRTVDVMVDELRGLLGSAAIEPPYVLVGHSFGGLVIKLFAHRHPDEVAGLVFLDSAHEEQFLRMPEELKAMQAPMFQGLSAMLRQLAAQAREGKLAEDQVPVTQVTDPQWASLYRRVLLERPGNFEGMAAEMDELFASHSMLRAEEIHSLGSVPVEVVTHGRLEKAATSGMNLSRAVIEEYERTWQDLQRELAGLSTRGRQYVLPNAGHMIHHDDPEAVQKAIRRVLTDGG